MYSIQRVRLVLFEHPFDEQLEHFARQARTVDFAQFQAQCLTSDPHSASLS